MLNIKHNQFYQIINTPSGVIKIITDPQIKEKGRDNFVKIYSTIAITTATEKELDITRKAFSKEVKTWNNN